MKLHELRQLLAKYDKTWYARKLILGDHNEVVQLKQFVKKYDLKPGDYEFTITDKFELIKLIPANCDLPIIESLKNDFDTNYLYQIFVAFNRYGMVTQHNFETMNELSFHTCREIYRLFCFEETAKELKAPEVLDLVLSVVSRPAFDLGSIKKCLTLLASKKQLSPLALNFIRSGSEGGRHILKIFEELALANSLNDTSIAYLPKNTLYAVAEFFVLLNRADVKITPVILILLSTNTNIGQVKEALSAVVDSDCHVNQQMVVMLLQQGLNFFLDKNDIFKMLQAYGMLDDKSFEFTCKIEEGFLFTRLLTILSQATLLFKNKIIIDKIINQEIDLCRLAHSIQYLKKANILDQDTLELCTNVYVFKQTRPDFGDDIFQVINLLSKAGVDLHKDYFVSLFKWSPLNMQRLYFIVSGLQTNNLLTLSTFQEAAKRVSMKLPAVNESTAQKISRKQSGLPRTEVVLDEKLRLFKESGKDNEHGRYGKVKKGFNAQENSEPVFATKKLIESDLAVSREAAIREVKYHRFLGRDAFYFVNNKVTIVSEWQREKALHLFTRDELLQAPILHRLRCLKSALSELNQFHHQFRIHNDIKYQNCVLDLKNLSMRLIDFGAAHKRGTKKIFALTPAFTDPHLTSDHYCRDIYSMGIVIRQLFPEIYTQTIIEGKIHLGVNRHEFKPEETAIIMLVNSMMHNNYRVRCTSEDALRFSDEVINHYDQLNQAVLDNIADSTICRTESTVEDLLRESPRSAR